MVDGTILFTAECMILSMGDMVLIDGAVRTMAAMGIIITTIHTGMVMVEATM
jgi:hypothetical protein